MDKKINQLQNLINDSPYTIIITGAGISMSAGIMDMEHMNVFQIMQTSVESLVKVKPEHSYKLLKKNFLNAIFTNGPTSTHQKLVELENKGKIQGIITTNIDNLHKIAGSKNVAEIQGSYAINKCTKCGKQYNDINIWNQGKAPHCQECNGVIVSFPVYSNVGLYDIDYQKAKKWIAQAKLVIVVGSKGMYGNYLNNLRTDVKIVQINPKSTQFDNMTTLNISEESDKVFNLIK